MKPHRCGRRQRRAPRRSPNFREASGFTHYLTVMFASCIVKVRHQGACCKNSLPRGPPVNWPRGPSPLRPPHRLVLRSTPRHRVLPGDDPWRRNGPVLARRVLGIGTIEAAWAGRKGTANRRYHPVSALTEMSYVDQLTVARGPRMSAWSTPPGFPEPRRRPADLTHPQVPTVSSPAIPAGNGKAGGSVGVSTSCPAGGRFWIGGPTLRETRTSVLGPPTATPI